MRGLIYKELSIFFKSLDRRLFLIVMAVIVLLMYNTKANSGLLVSIMLSMMVGIQNVVSFAVDEKADWGKYQMAMPVNRVTVVLSKYLSVVCTLAVSVMGSLLFNLLSSIVFRQFDLVAWETSVAIAILLPLIWSVICLPLYYWFGFRSANVMRLAAVIPIVYLISYFEDGPGLSQMAGTLPAYAMILFLAVLVCSGISIGISIMGCQRRK